MKLADVIRALTGNSWDFFKPTPLPVSSVKKIVSHSKVSSQIPASILNDDDLIDHSIKDHVKAFKPNVNGAYAVNSGSWLINPDDMQYLFPTTQSSSSARRSSRSPNEQPKTIDLFRRYFQTFNKKIFQNILKNCPIPDEDIPEAGKHTITIPFAQANYNEAVGVHPLARLSAGRTIDNMILNFDQGRLRSIYPNFQTVATTVPASLADTVFASNNNNNNNNSLFDDNNDDDSDDGTGSRSNPPPLNPGGNNRLIITSSPPSSNSTSSSTQISSSNSRSSLPITTSPSSPSPNNNPPPSSLSPFNNMSFQPTTEDEIMFSRVRTGIYNLMNPTTKRNDPFEKKMLSTFYRYGGD
jgi:hypothetical protein